MNQGNALNSRPAAYSFKSLAVWQRAQELTVRVIVLSDAWPRDRSTSVIVQQIVRSSSSIAANIAEGHGRFATGAYRNHLSIARGSASETLNWIDLLRRTGRITEAIESELAALCVAIIKMLTAQMINLAQKRPSATEG